MKVAQRKILKPMHVISFKVFFLAPFPPCELSFFSVSSCGHIQGGWLQSHRPLSFLRLLAAVVTGAWSCLEVVVLSLLWRCFRNIFFLIFPDDLLVFFCLARVQHRAHSDTKTLQIALLPFHPNRLNQYNTNESYTNDDNSKDTW